MANFISAGQLASVAGGSGSLANLPIADPGVPLSIYGRDGTVDPNEIWRTQPSVRKVVEWRARLLASVDYVLYERGEKGQPTRVDNHPIARLLGRPSRRLSPYDFLFTFAVDRHMYDRAAAALTRADDGFALRLLTAAQTELVSDAFREVTNVRISGKNGAPVEMDPALVVYTHGWDGYLAGGVSPMRTLSDLLAEMRTTTEYRQAMFKNAARVPTVLNRPNDAPKWSDTARDRFAASWAAFTRGGGKEGGTPILEDGMTLTKVDAFKPMETGDLEGRKLTDAQAASAYFTPPELVGAAPGNFGSIDAWRQTIYGPVLGPDLRQMAQALTATLVPILGEGRDLFIAPDVDEKMRGSFIEQAEAASTSTGAPWQTRNEMRKRYNMPPIEGGDELVVPLNVLVGGLASPRDTAPKHRDTVEVKSKPTARYREALTDSLLSEYRKALAEVLERYPLREPVKAGNPTDALDVYQVLGKVFRGGNAQQLIADRGFRLSEAGAQDILMKWNPNSAGFNPEAMRAWVLKAADTNSNLFADRLSAHFGDLILGPGWGDDVDFDEAEGIVRRFATTWGTQFVEFGRHDAARASGLKSKTWRTNSATPRASHAALNGVTVPLDAPFANGCSYPGDWAGGADEVANCECSTEYGTEQ